MWAKMLEYILAHRAALLAQIGTHLWISLAALAAAVRIGVPCGYLAADSPGTEKWISAPFHIQRVLPSLAIIVLLIPDHMGIIRSLKNRYANFLCGQGFDRPHNA